MSNCDAFGASGDNQVLAERDGAYANSRRVESGASTKVQNVLHVEWQQGGKRAYKWLIAFVIAAQVLMVVVVRHWGSKRA